MTKMKDVLSDLIYDNNSDELCRLCFKSAGENALRVRDEIFVEDQGVEEMQTILSYVLGDEIFDCLSVHDPICEQCRQSAINSYKFIRLCKDNVKKLSTAIDGLTGCIENTADDIELYKTVFLIINTNESSSQQLCDNKKSFNIQSAIKRLHTLSYPKTKKVKQEKHYDYQGYEENIPDDYLEVEGGQLPDEVNNVIKRDICTVFISKSGVKTFQCNSCPKGFSKYYSVERHNINVHFAKAVERRPYNRVFSKEDPDEKMKRICTVLMEDDKRKYLCKICSAVFKTYRSLQNHYSRFHEPRVLELFICSKCGKTFKEKYSLRKHELMHNSAVSNKVSCPICNKVYKSVSYLKVHLCNPNNERIVVPKQFVCDICGKKYGRKNTLRYHIEYMHQREGFVCMWCGKKLPSKSALNGHIVTHTKERNYKCDVCNGLFVTSAALKTHTRIHTGERPYACEAPGCDLRFISASRRSEHYKRRHTEPSIECDICHKVFRARQALMKHLKRHYNPRSGLYMPKDVFSRPH